MKRVVEPSNRHFHLRRRQRQWQLLGLLVGSLLFVLFGSETRWLSRLQLSLASPLPRPEWITGPTAGGDAEAALDGLRAAAARTPANKPMQVALARTLTPAEQKIAFADTEFPPPPAVSPQAAKPGEATIVTTSAPKPYSARLMRLKAVIAQTQPSDLLPALSYAAFLRYATLDDVQIDRDETARLERSPQRPATRTIVPLNPQVAADFERFAREGEALDRENAFFPAMLSCLHFAQKRDREALEDLDRAASRSDWNDYTAQEASGMMMLYAAAFGASSSASRLAIVSSQLYPHFDPLRGMARMALLHALAEEQAGNREAGVAIRARLMRVAVQIREKSNLLIGYYTGIALFDIAASHPGGQPEAVKKEAANGDARTHRRELLSRYIAYLGDSPFVSEKAFSEEANWVHMQRDILENVPQVTWDMPVRELTVGWALNLYLLVQVGLFLLFGGMASVWAYRQRFAPLRPQGLSQPMAFGIAQGIVLGCLVIALLLNVSGSHRNTWPETRSALDDLLAVSAIVGLPMLCFLLAMISRARVFFLALGASLLMTGALLGVMVLQMGHLAGYLYALTGFAVNPAAAGSASTDTIWWVLWYLAAPALLAIVLLIHSVWKRTPAVTGMLRSFQRCAVPVTILLLSGYLGSFFYTLHQEREMNNYLTQMLVNERALAKPSSSVY